MKSSATYTLTLDDAERENIRQLMNAAIKGGATLDPYDRDYDDYHEWKPNTDMKDFIGELTTRLGFAADFDNLYYLDDDELAKAKDDVMTDLLNTIVEAINLAGSTMDDREALVYLVRHTKRLFLKCQEMLQTLAKKEDFNVEDLSGCSLREPVQPPNALAGLRLAQCALERCFDSGHAEELGAIIKSVEELQKKVAAEHEEALQEWKKDNTAEAAEKE